MAVKTPDFKIKNGLTVGTDVAGTGHTTVKGGLTAEENSLFGAEVEITEKLTIGGDLVVNGSTTTIDTTAVQVEDPLLSLGMGNDGDLKDIGFYGRYVTGGVTSYAGLFRDATNSGLFKLFSGLSAEPNVGVGNYVDTTEASYTKATLQADLNGTADYADQLSGPVSLNFTGDNTGDVGSVTGTFVGIRGNSDGTAQIISSPLYLVPNVVATDHIKNSSITTTKIADNQVIESKIGENVVSLRNIDTNAVSADELCVSAVGEEHFRIDSIGNSAMKADAILNTNILSGTIDGSTKFLDGSIIHAKMGANSVGETNYIDGSIKNEHIADDQINSEHYAALSIDNEHYANDSISLAKMQVESIDSDQFVNRCIDYEHIALSSIKVEHLMNEDLLEGGVENGHPQNMFVINNQPITAFGQIFDVGAISDVGDSASVNMSIVSSPGPNETIKQTISADVNVDDSTIEVYGTSASGGIRVKDLGIVTAKIGNLQVTTAKIADDNVTSAKLNSTDGAEAVTTDVIRDGAVTDMKVLSSSTLGDDNNRAIGTHHVKDRSITEAKLATNSVTDSAVNLDFAQFKTFNSTVNSGSGYTTISRSASASYRSVQYFIQAADGTGYQTSTVTLLHNGVDVWVMETGIVTTKADGSSIVTYTADMDAGDSDNEVKLKAVCVNTSNTGTVKAVKTAVKA